MGFNVNKGPGRSMSEINVTPFVDVVLVLLVIFMITAPLMYNGIKLNLPKTKKVQSIKLSNDQIVLSISQAGEYFLGTQKILQQEMVDEIKVRLTKTNNQTLYLRANAGLKYGHVVKIMADLKRSGINQIALVTEIEKNER